MFDSFIKLTTHFNNLKVIAKIISNEPPRSQKRKAQPREKKNESSCTNGKLDRKSRRSGIYWPDQWSNRTSNGQLEPLSVPGRLHWGEEIPEKDKDDHDGEETLRKEGALK